ncbi:MAG: thiamine pyrophosphate-binding protein [bacterium]|nr:benzaldehyde lyase [Deltaproteobacteria bacterium]MCP4907846.1 thiamine pyrophosphate-binding protein [bacterium]
MAVVDGGELLVRALLRAEVEELFVLSGGHLDPIFFSASDHGIRITDTRHEAAATHMADGYARATGKLGVAVITAGPGVTNGITGIATAYADASPILVIGGRFPLRDEDRLALQAIDQISLVKPVTKFARTILHTDRIPELTSMAIRHAVSGRPGPSFLDIPLDILFTPIEEGDVPTFRHTVPRGLPTPKSDSIDEALEALVRAERPAIFAGGGVRFSEAQEALRKFAEAAQIPVFASSKARGCVSEYTPLGYGGFGLSASRALHERSGGAPDVVMLLGARIGMFTGSSGGGRSMIPSDATIIQVDIVAEEIGRNHDVEIGLVGDVALTLEIMNERAKGLVFQDHKIWLDALDGARNSFRKTHESLMFRDERPIHQARICREIADFLCEDDILVADGGDTANWMAEQAIVGHGGRFISHGYLGTLGIGVPFGLAAQAAHPDRRVLILLGDGAAGFNFAEFETAMRHGLNVVVVINNDQGWGMIRHDQLKRYGRVVGAELGLVHYEKAAAGFGCHAEFVEDASEIRPALERAFASGRAACVNIMSDASQPHAPPSRGKSVATGPAATPDVGDEIVLPYYGKRKLDN